MKLSGSGAAAIKREEGGSLHAYQDAGGVWTIGYGHTGSDVVAGSIWSEQQVDAAFAADIARVETALSSMLTRPRTQAELDGLASLGFNIGLGALAKSTIVRLLNAGVAAPVAALHFLDWIYVGSSINRGLVQRRGREMLRFLGYAV